MEFNNLKIDSTTTKVIKFTDIENNNLNTSDKFPNFYFN